MIKLNITLKDLIAQGVHFGHRPDKWNPKTKWFVLTKKNNIYIIDLRETVKGIIQASHLLSAVKNEGQQILFVCVKQQISAVVQNAAIALNMPYVSERWLGGTLTNFHTVTAQIKKLQEMENLINSNGISNYNKKEQAVIRRNFRKLKRNLYGLKNMNKLPGALLVVDPVVHKNAINEARIMKIPVVALLDTDADPDLVDVPIPCNDDAVRSVQYILNILVEAIKSTTKEVPNESKEKVVS